jgi:hypothetical protein
MPASSLRFIALLALVVVLLAACGRTGTRQAGAESARAPADSGPSPAAAATTAHEQAKASGQSAAPSGTGKVTTTPAPRSASPAAVSPPEEVSPSPSPAVSGTPAEVPARQGPRPDHPANRELDVPDPSIGTPSGVFASPQSVRIDCKLGEALIRYTLDGSTPSPAHGSEYSGPVRIDATKSLRAVAYIPGGRSSSVVTASYAIGEVFARPASSAASAALGTIDSPLEGLGQALGEARAKGITIVKAQAGTYSERVDIDKDIVIKGGYTADFARQDTARRASVVAGPESRGTTQSLPGYSIRFSGSAVTAGTILEGFTVKGGDANFSAAVVASDHAAPVIRSCSLVGGTGGYSYGLRSMTQASPRIEYSFIDGGEGGSSFGVSADGAAVSVAASTIVSGAGTAVSYGIALTGSRASVSGSVIEGGSASSSYGVAAYSAPELLLIGCTISGGRGSNAYAVFIASSAPDIRNCILFTRGARKAFGIYENYGDSDPKALEGNCVFDCPGGLYYDEDTRKAFTGVSPEGQFILPDGTVMTTPRGTANIMAAPLLGPAPDLRTSPESPQSVRGGGVAFPSGSDLDRDGRRRTAPYSIGAYEID